MPDPAFLDFVDQTTIKYIDFRSLSDVRKYIGKCPEANYVWDIYGELQAEMSLNSSRLHIVLGISSHSGCGVLKAQVGTDDGHDATGMHWY